MYSDKTKTGISSGSRFVTKRKISKENISQNNTGHKPKGLKDMSQSGIIWPVTWDQESVALFRYRRTQSGPKFSHRYSVCCSSLLADV